MLFPQAVKDHPCDRIDYKDQYKCTKYKELANRVGVTRQTIIALEASKYTPSLALAFRIARAFGVMVEDVFQYEDGGTSYTGI